MKRFHVHAHVEDLQASVVFHSKMLALRREGTRGPGVGVLRRQGVGRRAGSVLLPMRRIIARCRGLT